MYDLGGPVSGAREDEDDDEDEDGADEDAGLLDKYGA